jgi:hypothetical protein
MTELEDLRLELAAQKALKEDWKKAAGERLDEITRLRAEVEELREDKKRLDWLDKQREYIQGDGIHYPHQEHQYYSWEICSDEVTCDKARENIKQTTIRAAIDAAREGE